MSSESPQHLQATRETRLPRVPSLRETRTTPPRRWNPAWLRNSTVGCVAITLSLLAAGLIILWQISVRTDGIQILSDNHYLWTYGPTALLVFLVSVWRQLDHEIKVLIPWTILENGPANADNSIKLDYVSPLLVVSAIEAFKRRHLVVTSSILGFALLKLTTLASTALLDVREVRLTSQTDSIVRTSTFNGELFDQDAFNTETDSSVVYTAFGLSSYDTEHADGVGDGFVFETFETSSVLRSANVELRADVITLEPDFGCSLAEVSINANPDDTQLTNASRGRIEVNSPACTFTGVEPTFLIDRSILESQVAPVIQMRGIMERVDCPDFETLGSNKDNLRLLVLAEIGYAQSFADSGPQSTLDVGQAANITAWSATVRRTKSMVCNPQLRQANSTILYKPLVATSSSSLEGQPGPATFFERFTGDNLTNAFAASMLDAAGLFGVASSANSLLLKDHPHTMFKMMADTLFHERAEIGISGYEVLFSEDGDGDPMIKAANTVFKTVASQIIHKNIRLPVRESTTGIVTITNRRLIVSEISVWLMFAGFVLLIAITVHIWLRRPLPILPHHPESSIALSEHLPPSEELSFLLHKAEDLDKHQGSSLLQGCLFGSSWSAGPLDIRSAFELYSTRAATSETPLIGPEEHSSQSSEWWVPLMLRPSMVTLTLVLPLLAIGALEAVHQVAIGRSQDAIVLIDERDADNSLLWARAIPALVMLLISTLVNSVDFNITLLGPFAALKDQAFPISSFPGTSLVGALPPVALWRAMRSRLWPVAASMTAALIGSVLTIVVSGLLTFEPALRTEVIDMAKSEVFNTTTPSAMIDPADAAALVSLLESSNLSYPANTYEELAFPSIGSPEDASNDSNTTLEVDLPALRASLGCVALPSSAFNGSISLNPRIRSASVTVNARATLPPGCQRGGPDGNLTFLDFPFTQPLPSTINATYIGKLLSLHVGPYDRILDSPAGETSPNQPDNPPGCPTLAFIYGLADPSTNTTNLTTLICTQHLESLATHTFLTPSHRILNSTLLSPSSSSQSPSFLPASPTNPKNTTAFSFRIQQSLDQTLSIFNQTTFPSSANAASPVDPFFQGVLFGRTGLFNSEDGGGSGGEGPGKAAFAGTADDDRRVVFDAIQRFYRRYMAQAVSLNMRRPVPVSVAAVGGGGDGDVVDAETGSATDVRGEWRVTVHDSGSRLKLVMHRESKLALQGMLGAMVLLMGFAVWSAGGGGGGGGVREVVRANPCEIWGRLRLVAGSRLGEEMRRRAKEGEGEGDRPDRGMVGMEVKLGWWERETWGGGGRRWGIDVVEGVRETLLRGELGVGEAVEGGKATGTSVSARDRWI